MSLSSLDATIVQNHPIISLPTECSESDASHCEIDPSDITTLISKVHIGTLQTDAADQAKTVRQRDESTTSHRLHAKDELFLGVNELSISSIRASLVPFYHDSMIVELFHNDTPLRLCWNKIRFGISRKFLDHEVRPRVNIVVDIPPDLCETLDATDAAARNLPIDSSTSSVWRPIVMRKEGFANYPTVRLQITQDPMEMIPGVESRYTKKKNLWEPIESSASVAKILKARASVTSRYPRCILLTRTLRISTNDRDTSGSKKVGYPPEEMI